MHDHSGKISDDSYSPLADECPSELADLPCGCQDVHYGCGYVDYEHDYVTCGPDDNENTLDFTEQMKG